MARLPRIVILLTHYHFWQPSLHALIQSSLRLGIFLMKSLTILRILQSIGDSLPCFIS